MRNIGSVKSGVLESALAMGSAGIKPKSIFLAISPLIMVLVRPSEMRSVTLG